MSNIASNMLKQLEATIGKNIYKTYANKDSDDANTPEQDAVYYIVKKGDTLGKIAKKYGTTVHDILEYNKKNYSRITESFIIVGWQLRIR